MLIFSGVFCPKCQTENIETANYCVTCSYKFPLKNIDYSSLRNFAVIALFSMIISFFLNYYLFYNFVGLINSRYLTAIPVFLYSLSLIFLGNAYSKLSGGYYSFKAEQIAALIAAILRIILFLMVFPLIFLHVFFLFKTINYIDNLIYTVIFVVSLIFEFGFIKIGIEKNSSGMKIAGVIYIIGQIISASVFFMIYLIEFGFIKILNYQELHLLELEINLMGIILFIVSLLGIAVFSIRSQSEYEK